ncbi:uncharacterized protein LOC132169189 [Corylus avellana]|uniref:uncharacterized protein LOC132169189 n=1 Tax=Corylus avellana TaxID=13451 RepID=UPI00286B155E|nr:uncharacterized protein LOC132169189 [Corylus avellana]
MAEQLEKLWGTISLTEGEKNGIAITEGEIEEARAQGGRCLIGKLWMGKRVNKDALKTVLSRIWRTLGGIIFKELDDNIWLFEFEDVEDLRRVLEGRPWSFDRHILVLKEFDGSTPPSQMAFTHSPFWVQIHDMPLLCMTKGVGTKIGESMGQLEDIDLAGDGVGWGRCLRIRVVIDLSKPLERGRALMLEGKSHWVTCRYEKLPMACFDCGRVIHGEKGCPIPRNTTSNTKAGGREWGVWLRADDGQRRRVGGDESGAGGEKSSKHGDMGDGGAGLHRRNTYMESSGFSGNPSQKSCSNYSPRSGESPSFHHGAAGGTNKKGKEKIGESAGQTAENQGSHAISVPDVGDTNSIEVEGAGNGKKDQDSGPKKKVQMGLSNNMGQSAVDKTLGLHELTPTPTQMDVTPISQPKMNVNPPASLRTWKRKAREGLSKTSTGEAGHQLNKKRKEKTSGDEGATEWGDKRGRMTGVEVGGNNKVRAVAEFQPRHQQ